jgi:chromate reductase, NAD(P)H dehydrogenase (quinone)
MTAPRLLLMAGSARTAALSAKLLHEVTRMAQDGGAQTTGVDLRALNLPLYDGDLEAAQGAPQGARQLRDLFAEHDGALIVTPEYNGFPTPLVINAFDWLSRVKADGAQPAGLAATANKVAGLLSSSPGPLGGLRALNYMRQYLSMSFAMLVVPQQFALGRAGEAFADDGRLADAAQREAVRKVVDSTLRIARATAGR